MYRENTHQAGKPDRAMITANASIKKAALRYIKAGFALTPCEGKQAFLNQWNARSKAITSADQVTDLDSNIGILHAYSGTCAIDVDDLQAALDYFEATGLDLMQLLTADDAVQIVSGRENRAKLLYRINEPLTTWQEYAADGAMMLEFRCMDKGGKSHQDVLPPSIHPDTGKPYKWKGNFRKLPILPAALEELWRKENSTEKSACDTIPKPPKESSHRKGYIFPLAISATFPVAISVSSRTFPPFSEQKTASVTQEEINQFCITPKVQKHLLTCLAFKDFSKLFITEDVSVFNPFREDKHKSAGLKIGSESRQVLFHDFSGFYGSHYLQLNSLYATLISGSLMILKPTISEGRKIGVVTSGVWWLRLMIDCGVIAPCKVDMPACPANARKTTIKVYVGIKRLFEVRWTFKGREGEPITLARKFVGPWCGVSEVQARNSMRYLLQHCIHTAGKHGLSNTYLPGYKPLQPKGRNGK